MNRRNQRKLNALANQATELSFAAPQVMAHRLGRLALSNGRASSADAAEFHRMCAEKPAAFLAAWTAMGWEAMRAQQVWAAAMARAFLRLTPMGAPAIAAMWQAAGLGLVASGLEPLHRAATGNARRLSLVQLPYRRR
jgi:hypothetical protein